MTPVTQAEVNRALRGFPHNLAWRDFRTVQNSPSPPMQAQQSSTYRTSGWNVAIRQGDYRVVGFSVTVSVNRQRSWAVPGARSNAALLRHEQGHYDITGLIARDLTRSVLQLSYNRDVVAAMRGTGTTAAAQRRWVFEEFRDSIDGYVNEANRLIARFQTHPVTGADGVYDRETRHGLNTNAQNVWNDRLARMKAGDMDFGLWVLMSGA